MANSIRQPTRRQWLQTIAAGAGALALQNCRTRSPDVPDVCIVGSGPAGAILAWRMASRGARVLLLEGGANPVRPSATALRPPSVAEIDPVGYPIDDTRFLGEGGTSNLWGGECPRLQPHDFSAGNPSANAPWPITWDELEPFYCQAESELSIAGGWENRFSPPRSQRFPIELDAAASAGCLRALLEKAGIASQPSPVSQSYRIVASHLPKLSALATVTFQKDVRVTRIVADRQGRVTRLEARDRAGQQRSIEAHAYVLACGGIETPRLLLRSDVGNQHDQVGRYFMEHLAVDLGTYHLPSAVGCPTDEAVLTWQFTEDFTRRGLGAAVFEIMLSPKSRVVSIGAILEMRSAADNRVRLSSSARDAHGEAGAALALRISDSERNAWKYACEVAGRIGRALGAKPVNPPREAFFWCHHHMGTCRMGRDPRSSVVDQNLRVHGVDNLHVAGSAAFVTAGVGSPTLLLTALGCRLADHLLAGATTPAASRSTQSRS